jgi:hypothetical protein
MTIYGEWPKSIAEPAFHGLAGEIVRTIEPHTESDPAALLVQFHVAFGNLVHRNIHWQVEATRHGLNLFTVLVGETSKARKGTSLSHVRKVTSSTDDVWAKYGWQTGLNSGEGLIHAVRDPGEADDTGKEVDNGPLDTRLLVIESEFASTLRVMSRDGNTLSPVIRQAWDGSILQVLTKNSPEIASYAHISIIGHITEGELKQEMTRTDMANGFGNRFLWVCVRRHKLLPDGGCLAESQVNRLRGQIIGAVQFANSLGDYELVRDQEASALWCSAYADLSEGRRGLFGALTSRAEAQVMRLACIYALLDRSTVIQKVHLEAAMAVWKYCEDSARYIFGDAVGDVLADTLLRALRLNPNGMTRTEISTFFNRNRQSSEIDRALAKLQAAGLARMEIEGTESRPAVRWFAIQ